MLTFRNMTIQDRDLVLPMVETFYQSDAVDHPVLRGILVYQGQEPAGYIYVTQCYSAEVGGRCVFIEEIFLAAPFRGQGLGREIMAWLEREYPAARRFRLEVTQINQGAIRLYEKSGYQYLRYDQMVLDKIK